MDTDILVNINQLVQGMAGVGVGRVTFVAFANFYSINTALWPFEAIAVTSLNTELVRTSLTI